MSQKIIFVRFEDFWEVAHEANEWPNELGSLVMMCNHVNAPSPCEKLHLCKLVERIGIQMMLASYLPRYLSFTIFFYFSSNHPTIFLSVIIYCAPFYIFSHFSRLRHKHCPELLLWYFSSSTSSPQFCSISFIVLLFQSHPSFLSLSLADAYFEENKNLFCIPFSFYIFGYLIHFFGCIMILILCLYVYMMPVRPVLVNIALYISHIINQV